MNEKPILFNAEMVRAVLDLRKTQTRRAIDIKKYGDYLQETDTVSGNPAYPCYQDEYGDSHPTASKCPYGKKGDRLWVREAWNVSTGISKLGYNQLIEIPKKKLPYHMIHYRQYENDLRLTDCMKTWRPSIHMPRWASRINLEITDIRVERVQDISEADCKAEGVDGIPDPTILGTNYHHIIPFAELWDSINEKRGFGWGANPWVWVVEFKLLKSC